MTIPLRISRTDLDLWLDEPIPVILMLYDASADESYWLYLHAHFESQLGFDISRVGRSVRVHFNRRNRVDEAAFRKFAEFRDNVLSQVEGEIHHHA